MVSDLCQQFHFFFFFCFVFRFFFFFFFAGGKGEALVSPQRVPVALPQQILKRVENLLQLLVFS